MSKRWMLIVGGIVVVALALVGVQIAMSKKGSSGSNPAINQSINGTGTTTASGANGSDTTRTGAGKGSGSGSKGGGTGSRSSSDSNSSSGLKPFPAMPASKLQPIKVTSPAAPGQELAPLSDAPGKTVAGLKIGQVPEGAQYTVKLRPYGIGPSIVLGSLLVINVDSISPVNQAPQLPKLENAIVLALVDTSHAGTITKGGSYTGTLTFRSDGQKMLPILSNVIAAK